MSSCIVKVTTTAAAAIGCTIHFKKITWCSNVGAKLADALSKARFHEFFDIADSNRWLLCQEPLKVSATIKRWLLNPMPDDDLGKKLVEEMSKHTAIIGY